MRVRGGTPPTHAHANVWLCSTMHRCRSPMPCVAPLRSAPLPSPPSLAASLPCAGVPLYVCACLVFMLWCRAAVCSNNIVVGGQVWAGLLGTYTKVAGLTFNDRPVYQLVGCEVVFISFSVKDGWVINIDYTSEAINAHAPGAAASCPEQASGWQVWTGTVWSSTVPITLVGAGAP